MSAAAAADCGGGCCCCSILALSSAKSISSEAEGDMAEADEAVTAAKRGDVGEGASPWCFRSLQRTSNIIDNCRFHCLFRLFFSLSF